MSNMMMVREQLKSVSGTHFAGGALADNAGEKENISFPDYFVQAGINKIRIHRIVITFDGTNTLASLDWELQFFGSDLALGTDIDAENAQSKVSFANASGEVITGSAAIYRYTQDLGDSPIYYEDEDRTSELHVMLVNRNATTFHADDEVQITFTVSPLE